MPSRRRPLLISFALAIASVAGMARDAGADHSPPRPRVVTTSTSMVILEPIRFVGTSAAIDSRSDAMLDTIATTFNGHTDLALIEVRVHGPLGLARARSVVEALAARGVARRRLRPVGKPAPAAHSGTLSPGPEFRILRRRR